MRKILFIPVIPAIPAIMVKGMVRGIVMGLVVGTSVLLPLSICQAEVRTVVIDAGHGGYDLGLRTHEVGEKDQMLSMARGLQRKIEASGRFAFLAREVDHYLSIEDRRAVANKLKPDVFISLHMSSTDSITVYVTWFEKKDADLDLSEYYSVDSRQRRYVYESFSLSGYIAEAFREDVAVNVYEMEMALPLLDGIGAPAIMVEMPSKDFDYKVEGAKIIQALYEGILRYEQGR